MFFFVSQVRGIGSGALMLSFKNPTDTMLPTQALDIGEKLSSGQMAGNFLKGRFQLRMLPEGNLVLNTMSVPSEYAYEPYYVSNTEDSGKIVPTSDFYHRATLNFDGIFTQYAHPKPSRNTSLDQSWFPVWSIPDNICLATLGTLGSGVCGFNSYCILDSNSRPKCACPPGYSYIDPNNTFNGCKLDRVPSTCHGEDQENHEPEELYDMHVMSSTFWPTSNYEVQQKFNETECRQSCLYDCHCMVAVSRAGFCFKKKLPLSNGKVDPAFPATCFIKDTGPDRINSFRRLSVPEYCSGNLNTNFSYETSEKLLMDSKKNLGKGSFGTVYKGFLTSSTSSELAAVKKLDRVIEEGEHEFKTEVSVIAQTHHRNLVRLLGFCDEGPHKLLVYEFMSNGSLASYLFGVSRPSWSKRIQIISGIARGLLYLHEDCAMQIIHCDIKPQNILLDDSLTAKISDFGLAKLLLSDQTRTNTAIRGTRGYIAPEWFKNIPITAKADVYSYGVILLEIICCRKNVEQGMEDEDEFVLTDWAYDCYRHRELHKLLKSDKEARNDRKRVEKLVMVAIWCIQEDPCLRPTMKKVIQMLEGVIDVSVPPCPFPLSSVC
ncbi:LOW QUALITY PROTEIN: G-type lectin S-receptor-like serine/threonine-protein kinase LECRK2 [Carica papaya]|uniref:LOW QUALITY PROTEIN: G-type lectin S-receptor-like serine/threonine-protein kinase LECRK2 n=1 Tax=Carica papaya TaxID=3649 RepID=UPI000B8D08D4|nr:LOW QUALITY PROTEIN: G-type lectin S-receptor-like serine/threonine-protein kinase LECRK2 [Carica papaya]